MRFLKLFLLSAALALGLFPARASAQVRLIVPGQALAPAACPLVLPSAAAGFVPSLSASPASLAPSIIPSASLSVPLIIQPSAPVARPAAAPLSPDETARRYADFFDGAAPAEDGEAVSPRLAVGAGPAFREPVQLNIVRAAVQRALPALSESVSRGAWNGPHTTLDESCCGDAAPKLAMLLRAQGVPARLVEAEFHYYVMLDLPEGRIIVDPTVRQFFGKKGAPRTVPHVFVGTVGDLQLFFQRHAAVKTTRYDPQRIYFREAVVREDALRALEAKVRAGEEAEHEPLRRFLGLVPDAPRPAGPPRLIIP